MRAENSSYLCCAVHPVLWPGLDILKLNLMYPKVKKGPKFREQWNLLIGNKGDNCHIFKRSRKKASPWKVFSSSNNNRNNYLLLKSALKLSQFKT